MTSKQKRAGPPPVKLSDSFDCCKGKTCDLHRDSSLSVLSRSPVTTWTSLTNMPRDIAEYAIDAPIHFDAKRKSIQMHTLDDKLNVFQRAVLSMNSEEAYEKSYVASKIEDYCRQNADKFFSDILPLIEKELSRQNTEFHRATAQGVMKAAKNLYGRNLTQAKYLMQLIFRNLENGTDEISEYWTDAAKDVIGMLSPKEIEKEYINVVMNLSKNPNPHARKAACALIKTTILRLPPSVGANFSTRMNELCEDTVPFVRSAMAQHIASVYPYLNLHDSLLRNLTTLAKDTDPNVRACLMEALGQSFKLPGMKSNYPAILALIRKTVKQAFVNGDLPVLLEFTQYVGEMAKVFAEAGVLNADTKLWFLDAFFQLTRYGLEAHGSGGSDMPTGFLNFRANMDYTRRHSLVESLVSSGAPPTMPNSPNRANILENGWKVRRNAAQEFKNFVRFAKPLVDFKAGLQPLIGDLIHDPNCEVRAAMAGCLWPVMEYLGNLGHLLYGEFVYTLSDDSISVVEAVVPYFTDILRMLVAGKVVSPDVMTQALVEVGGAIIFCEERLNQANNWRVHSALLEQLAILPYCLPLDYINSNFVPILFHRLVHLRPLPSRMGAADAIVSFLRHSRRAQQREEIRRRLKDSFALGKSVQDRMLFLYMSKKIIDNFSRKYFRDHFFEQTLIMADDTVPNVRLRLTNMMPDMKNTLRPADDMPLLKKLEAAVAKIRSSETDRDVQDAIEEAVQNMKDIGVVFNSKDQDPKKSPGLKSKADAEDAAKEKEEAYIESLESSAPPMLSNKERRKSYFKTAKGPDQNAKPINKVNSGIVPKQSMTGEVRKGQDSGQKAPSRPGTVQFQTPPRASVANIAPGGAPPGQAVKPADNTRNAAGTNVSQAAVTAAADAEKTALAQAQRIRRRTLVPTQMTMMKTQVAPEFAKK